MFLVLLLLPLAHAISIHHRLFHPKASSFEYTPRAQLPLDSAPPFSPSLSEDISQQIRSLQDLSLDLDNALYQVALQRDGDQSDSQWDISSVKLVSLGLYACLHFPPNLNSSVISCTPRRTRLFCTPKEMMSTP